MPLKYTRAIIDAIHDNRLSEAPTTEDKTFGLQIVTECPGVPKEMLVPKMSWKKPEEYDAKAAHLAELFKKNFKKYEEGTSEEIRKAGPR